LKTNIIILFATITLIANSSYDNLSAFEGSNQSTINQEKNIKSNQTKIDPIFRERPLDKLNLKADGFNRNSFSKKSKEPKRYFKNLNPESLNESPIPTRSDDPSRDGPLLN
jgi:hypothetical protein